MEYILRGVKTTLYLTMKNLIPTISLPFHSFTNVDLTLIFQPTIIQILLIVFISMKYAGRLKLLTSAKDKKSERNRTYLWIRGGNILLTKEKREPL